MPYPDSALSVFLYSCGKQSGAPESEFALWNGDGTINELVSYAEDVTDEKSENFIPEKDRIAVFDLDVTLVGEQFLIYFEWLMFTQRVLDDPDFTADDEMKGTAVDILNAGKNRSIPEDVEERESRLLGQSVRWHDYRGLPQLCQ